MATGILPGEKGEGCTPWAPSILYLLVAVYVLPRMIWEFHGVSTCIKTVTSFFKASMHKSIRVPFSGGNDTETASEITLRRVRCLLLIRVIRFLTKAGVDLCHSITSSLVDQSMASVSMSDCKVSSWPSSSIASFASAGDAFVAPVDSS